MRAKSIEGQIADAQKAGRGVQKRFGRSEVTGLDATAMGFGKKS